ncbi:hypothetical protein BDB01DRAFT_849658 [Pilobolus umbonatus]|nr:hypothetical protein BDB01DRAFT_849658 [Pilobolus umbonatus]
MITIPDRPPSPTLSTSSVTSSVSWMHKSSTELIPMLKNAYSTLKDKEIELRLAAEIGNSLLENNKLLKTNYEVLLNTPYPTPSQSYSLIKEPERIDLEEEESELRYVPSRTKEALIEILESQKNDLNEKLELALQTQDKADRLNSKKTRELENEIRFLQTSLENATLKIQELENSRLVLVGKQEDSSKHMLESDVVEMRFQFEQLKIENDHVNQCKAEVEKKLNATLKDLRLLKEQYDNFQFKAFDHDELKTSFQNQQEHIRELKESLEEHRMIIQKLSDSGVHIPSGLFSSATQYDENGQDGRDEERMRIKCNLLSELENAWPKESETEEVLSSSEDGLSNSIQTVYDQLPSVDQALESILLKAGLVGKDALDDALSLIGRLESEYDHKKFLKANREWDYASSSDYDMDDLPVDNIYPVLTTVKPEVVPAPSKLSFRTYLEDVVKSMLYMSWKWLRFIIIMTIAVFISINEGVHEL